MRERNGMHDLAPCLLSLALLVLGPGYVWFLLSPETVPTWLASVALTIGMGLILAGVLCRSAQEKNARRKERA